MMTKKPKEVTAPKFEAGQVVYTVKTFTSRPPLVRRREVVQVRSRKGEHRLEYNYRCKGSTGNLKIFPESDLETEEAARCRWAEALQELITDTENEIAHNPQGRGIPVLTWLRQ
jgi:hypothetical protein